MLKWIIAIVLILFLGLWVVAYLHEVSLRQTGVIEGRGMLKIAAKDFAEYGYVTNVSGNSIRFWLSTNMVTIGGTQYQSYAEMGGGKFYDEARLPSRRIRFSFGWTRSGCRRLLMRIIERHSFRRDFEHETWG